MNSVPSFDFMPKVMLRTSELISLKKILNTNQWKLFLKGGKIHYIQIEISFSTSSILNSSNTILDIENALLEKNVIKILN